MMRTRVNERPRRSHWPECCVRKTTDGSSHAYYDEFWSFDQVRILGRRGWIPLVEFRKHSSGFKSCYLIRHWGFSNTVAYTLWIDACSWFVDCDSQTMASCVFGVGKALTRVVRLLFSAALVSEQNWSLVWWYCDGKLSFSQEIM
jgi:hypothetical protein